MLVWLLKLSVDNPNGYGWISSATTTAVNHLRRCREVTEDVRAAAEREHRKTSRSQSPAHRTPIPSPLSLPNDSDHPHGYISLDSPIMSSPNYRGHSTSSLPSSPTPLSNLPLPQSSYNSIPGPSHQPRSSSAHSFAPLHSGIPRSHSRTPSLHSHADFIEPAWTKERQAQFETAIARLTVSAGFPLAWVDNPEWINFCAEFIPGAKSPSRKTLTTRIIPKAVEGLRASAEASARGHLATLQSDGWTGLNKHHLLGMMLGANGKVC